MKVPAIILAGTLVALSTAVARATDLSAKINVDNDFGLYVSTDDSVLGTPVMEYLNGSNQWELTRSGSATLTPNVTNYIHVVGVDRGGGYAMFLGQFNLSDTGFSFANGSQLLLTGNSAIQVSKTGFGANYAPTTDVGPNGTLPWDVIGGVDINAHLVWSDTIAPVQPCCAAQYQTSYFSAAVNPIPTNDATTPEPTTLSLLALGGIPLLLKRRRAASR